MARKGKSIVYRLFIATAVLLALCGVCLVPVKPTRLTRRTLQSLCRSNLCQIRLALANYHDVYGSYPPPVVRDARGRALHSWRVLILPYLECGPLYGRYRLDDPWDSPANREIVSKVGDLGIFQCPAALRDGVNKRPDETNYMMVVGAEGVRSDQSSRVILVEVYGTGIAWNQPGDLHAATMAMQINGPEARSIRSRHRGGAHGSRSYEEIILLPEDMPPRELDKWLLILEP